MPLSQEEEYISSQPWDSKERIGEVIKLLLQSKATEDCHWGSLKAFAAMYWIKQILIGPRSFPDVIGATVVTSTDPFITQWGWGLQKGKLPSPSHVSPRSYKPHIFSTSPNPSIQRKVCHSFFYTINSLGAPYVYLIWKLNYGLLLSSSKKLQMWPGLSDSIAECWVRLAWVNTEEK